MSANSNQQAAKGAGLTWTRRFTQWMCPESRRLVLRFVGFLATTQENAYRAR
jgi:hypothetical protein